MSKIDAIKFVTQCRNWYEVALPVATHKKPARVTFYNGMRFESPFIYWPDIYEIFTRGMYTPEFLPIEQNDVVVDIGANIGVFTLHAAQHTDNIVHAFEPFPATFAALQKNISLNSKSNIVLHQCAVSDKIGMESFSAAAEGMNQLQKVIERQIAYIEVPSTTLNAFMDEQKLERIDFLKLDCEGSEGVILAALPTMYLQRIRKIALEFHDGISPLKHQQIQDLLKDAGFSTRIKWDGVSKLGLLYAWQA